MAAALSEDVDQLLDAGSSSSPSPSHDAVEIADAARSTSSVRQNRFSEDSLPGLLSRAQGERSSPSEAPGPISSISTIGSDGVAASSISRYAIRRSFDNLK